MAGHSQFKNIMHRKGAQDAKRAKVFTKLIRELTVAARSGLPDPASNPRLRAAVVAARNANMSKDTMERAIKRGAGGDGAAVLEEIRYEGYGPGGVAIIVDVLTDNRNRTASDIRSVFTKHGGNLGESGSVSFLFSRVGLVHYPTRAASADAVFEAALEAGATDVESGDAGHDVYCEPNDLGHIRDGLEKKFGAPESARLDWRAQSTVPVDADNASGLFKLLGALDDSDDVQRVASNYDVADDVMASLNA